VFGLRQKLRELNLLKNKHIPDIFLLSSYNQRLDVLRGFMDADGYYNKTRNRFVMSTTRESQAKNFNRLVCSLGIKTTVLHYKKRAMGKIVDVIDVLFRTDKLNPFLCRNQDYVGKISMKDNHSFKNIEKIELVDSTPTRCIEVSGKTHTFLYGDFFTITHNTNREFNYYSKFKNCLKPPFDYLQECQFSVYSIQLSIYALMYELETGKKCRSILICYWNKETERWQKIPTLYLKNEAKMLLESNI